MKVTKTNLIKIVKSMKAEQWTQNTYYRRGIMQEQYCIAGFLGHNIEPDALTNGVGRFTYFIENNTSFRETCRSGLANIINLNDSANSFKDAQKAILEFLKGLKVYKK